jgi:hypothetical protein
MSHVLFVGREILELLGILTLPELKLSLQPLLYLISGVCNFRLYFQASSLVYCPCAQAMSILFNIVFYLLKKKKRI